MSLKSLKSIDKAGPDRHDEVLITFRKESDNTYTKITKILSRDWKTGIIKQMKRELPVEEGPYEIVSETDSYDEKTSYEDIDGTQKFIYFRKFLN